MPRQALPRIASDEIQHSLGRLPKLVSLDNRNRGYADYGNISTRTFQRHRFGCV